MQKFLSLLATWFGAGLMKKAPGTWGTLAGLPFVYILGKLGNFWYMVAVVLFLPIAVLAAETYERAKGSHDSQEIVIDEVLGILITMTWLPINWQSFTFGFVLFRILDIFKPFPVGYLDRKVGGGLGVVVDDVAAGMIANLILQVIYAKTSWLGGQFVVFGS